MWKSRYSLRKMERPTLRRRSLLRLFPFATTVIMLMAFFVILSLHVELASDLISGREKENNVPLSFGRDLNAEETSIQKGLVSVLVPAYQASPFAEQLMRTLANQTIASRLEIIISIEGSEDAEQSEAIFKAYQARHPNLNILVHRHSRRLYINLNTRWLEKKARGEFYTTMAVDDTLPSNYYEELVKCLENNPQAVNCYPYILPIYADKNLEEKWNKPPELHQANITGTQNERVEKAFSTPCWIPIHGVVRRPIRRPTFDEISRFFHPRLRQDYTPTDEVACIKRAIAGELLEVPHLPYYKLYHIKSSHNSQFFNKSVFSLQDLQLNVVDHFTQSYNLVHSYVSSSAGTAQKTAKLVKHRMAWLAKQRNLEPSLSKKAQVQVEKDFSERIRQTKRVAVLGAGIQGCVLALMFSKHGYDVTLIDKSEDIMERASAAGEARIHSGIAFLKNSSFGTAKYMMQGGMRFSSYMEYLVGHKIDWDDLKSERLIALLPYDSFIKPMEFEKLGAELDQIYESVMASEPGLDYIGDLPHTFVGERVKIPDVVNSSYVEAAYETSEVCIEPAKLREIIRKALWEQGVTLITNRTVVDLKRNRPNSARLGRLRVVTDVGDNDYDAVVNSLWENRAAIDRKMGININADRESYRLEVSVRFFDKAHLLKDIPSMGMVNGPFGDFVKYPNNDAYFAWHPISAHMFAQNETYMHQFERHANGDFPDHFIEEFVKGHRQAFESLFPGHDSSSLFDGAVIRAGYIVGNGVTHDNDPKSQLYEWKDKPNLVSDGYISVKTQKFTTAPYNAYLLEKELFPDNFLGDANVKAAS